MSIYDELACRSIQPITALDGTTNRGPTGGIWSGSGGTIVVELTSDLPAVTTTFTSVAPGTWLPISIRRWVSGPADAIAVAV